MIGRKPVQRLQRWYLHRNLDVYLDRFRVLEAAVEGRQALPEVRRALRLRQGLGFGWRRNGRRLAADPVILSLCWFCMPAANLDMGHRNRWSRPSTLPSDSAGLWVCRTKGLPDLFALTVMTIFIWPTRTSLRHSAKRIQTFLKR